MGPALGTLAAEEIIALTVGTVVVGGATTYLAVRAFENAMQNCACGQAPEPQNSPGHRTFDISRPADISASTLVSAMLDGTTITNQKVPFTYSFLIGKGEAHGHNLFHAGILIAGDFEAEGEKYSFLFAERWNLIVRVNLFRCKSQALKLLRSIKVHGVQLTDCNETPSFTSMTTANAMVEFIHQELPRRLSVQSFRTLEDLNKMDVTNCIAFGMRAGILLGHDERDHFLTTCMTALSETSGGTCTLQ